MSCDFPRRLVAHVMQGLSDAEGTDMVAVFLGAIRHSRLPLHEALELYSVKSCGVLSMHMHMIFHFWIEIFAESAKRPNSLTAVYLAPPPRMFLMVFYLKRDCQTSRGEGSIPVL